MKAILLAAGLGTRLRPLTDTVPKCLVPVQGVPLLGIWLDTCARAGIDSVLVNLHHLPDRVREFLREYPGPVRVSTVYEETLLGTAGTVLNNRTFVDGEEAFFVIYVDNWTDVDLADMLAFHRARHADLTMAVFDAADPTGCGIVCVDAEDRIIDFEEKPAQLRSNLANAGILTIAPRVLDRVPVRFPLDFSFDVLPRFVGEIHAYRLPGFLYDLGTWENYRKVADGRERSKA
jgi:mannose-1-phosphate guanylyltransferase